MTTAEIYTGGYFAKKFKLEQNFSVQDKMGLHRYQMALFPNTYRNFSPGLDPQTKKPVTGLDPNSKDILAIKDDKVRTELQNKVVALKKEIEDYLGDPGILEPRSKYWKEFVFTIQVDKSGKLLLDSANGYNELDPASNPYHKLILCVMLSNDFLPTSRKEAGEPKWVDEKLLLTTEDEVEQVVDGAGGLRGPDRQPEGPVARGQEGDPRATDRQRVHQPAQDHVDFLLRSRRHSSASQPAIASTVTNPAISQNRASSA
jgi:hypothetical protein